MTTTEATQAGGTIYVPAGIRETYMTVNVWADDQETFDRIAAQFDAKLTETAPTRSADGWTVTPVASWKDGPVYYSCFGPSRLLAGGTESR